MRRIPPLLSKAAAIALTALALHLMYIALVSPVTRRLASLDEQIDEQRRLLGRYSDLLKTAKIDTETETATLQSLNFVILSGHTEQIKAASLQARVMQAANDVGIRIASLAVVPARSADGVRVVGVDVQFQSDLRRLQELLLGLETKQPTVLVDALQISKAPDASVRPERDLDVRLTALGVIGKAEESP
jgi:type II secretory pathway component PulM